MILFHNCHLFCLKTVFSKEKKKERKEKVIAELHARREATQMHLKVLFGTKSHDRPDF